MCWGLIVVAPMIDCSAIDRPPLRSSALGVHLMWQAPLTAYKSIPSLLIEVGN
jgi:hypothetical protein